MPSVHLWLEERIGCFPTLKMVHGQVLWYILLPLQPVLTDLTWKNIFTNSSLPKPPSYLGTIKRIYFSPCQIRQGLCVAIRRESLTVTTMPQVVARHDKSPKNKRNPKPLPIGNNFGFLSFGSPCWVSEDKTTWLLFYRTVWHKVRVVQDKLCLAKQYDTRLPPAP